MGSRRTLCALLSVLLAASSACTTGRMVPMQTQPGSTAPPSLKSGDHVRVHTHDGKHSDFDFDHVSAEGDVLGRHHEQVRANDTARVERRSIDEARTTLLIVSFGVAAVVILGLAAASGDSLPTGF